MMHPYQNCCHLRASLRCGSRTFPWQFSKIIARLHACSVLGQTCADDALLHNQLKHVPHHRSEELLLPAGLTDKVMTEFGFSASGEIQKDLYKCAVRKLDSLHSEVG